MGSADRFFQNHIGKAMQRYNNTKTSFLEFSVSSILDEIKPLISYMELYRPHPHSIYRYYLENSCVIIGGSIIIKHPVASRRLCPRFLLQKSTSAIFQPPFQKILGLPLTHTHTHARTHTHTHTYTHAHLNRDFDKIFVWEKSARFKLQLSQCTFNCFIHTVISLLLISNTASGP